MAFIKIHFNTNILILKTKIVESIINEYNIYRLINLITCENFLKKDIFVLIHQFHKKMFSEAQSEQFFKQPTEGVQTSKKETLQEIL